MNLKTLHPYVDSGAPWNELRTITPYPGGTLTVGAGTPFDSANLKGELIMSPFVDPTLRTTANYVRDRIGAILGLADFKFTIAQLIDTVASDKDLQSLPGETATDFIQMCLKALIANGGYVLQPKGGDFRIKLSEAYRDTEKARVFAAQCASEIEHLSERIGKIIPHQGEKGNYREELLRAVLEKHLPTRYHVATGFILGCQRQLDVLIYDQVDYSPVFREGNLVVVASEAVRAVIEVKTELDKAELFDSLDLIGEAALMDDRNPPFFKGIFAYSGTSGATIAKNVASYYQEDPFAAPPEAPSGDAPAKAKKEKEKGVAAILDTLKFPEIHEPFEHVTAVCIDKSVFATVTYETGAGGVLMVPAVRTAVSKTGLTPQTALFIEHLLSYLQVPVVKKRDPAPFSRMLGSDIDLGTATFIYAEKWGPYLRVASEVATRYLQNYTEAVENWRQGNGWSATLAEPPDSYF